VRNTFGDAECRGGQYDHRSGTEPSASGVTGITFEFTADGVDCGQVDGTCRKEHHIGHCVGLYVAGPSECCTEGPPMSEQRSAQRRLGRLQHHEWFDARSVVLHRSEGDWHTGEAGKESTIQCLDLKGTGNSVHCGAPTSDLKCNSGIDWSNSCPRGARQWIGSPLFVLSNSYRFAEHLGGEVREFRDCEVDVHQPRSKDPLQLSGFGDECRRHILFASYPGDNGGS